jgi:hypothetical protein
LLPWVNAAQQNWSADIEKKFCREVSYSVILGEASNVIAVQSTQGLRRSVCNTLEPRHSKTLNQFIRMPPSSETNRKKTCEVILEQRLQLEMAHTIIEEMSVTD